MFRRTKIEMCTDWQLQGAFLRVMLVLVIMALCISIACSSSGEAPSSSVGGDTGSEETVKSSEQEEAKPLSDEEIKEANRAKLFAGVKKIANPTKAENEAPSVGSQVAGDIVLTPESSSKAAVKQWDAPPPMSIDTNKQYTATIALEKGGEIVIELYAKKTPVTVNNFVFLARENFYDGLTFYRVFRELLAQAGDPTDGAPSKSVRGGGGPGYTFESEFSPDLRHDGPGTVSMANTGGTDTNGSQFFISFVASPDFDGINADGSPKDCGSTEGHERIGASFQAATGGGQTTNTVLMEEITCYTVFGRVTSGMEHAENLEPRRHVFHTPGDTISTITIDER